MVSAQAKRTKLDKLHDSLIEIYSNQLLANFHLPGVSGSKKQAFKDEIAFEIPFTKKVEIGMIAGLPKHIASMIYSLNSLRVAFARGFKRENRRY